MHSYAPPIDLLHDRVILVTGAGSGIGRAAALAFAEHGATVVLLGRTAAKLESLYDVIEARNFPRPALLPFDLASAGVDTYASIAETIAGEFGHLHGLVHNATELGVLAPIEHYDLAAWQRVLHVNLTAPFLLTRACLPLLKSAPDASVVFTSADVGRKGRAYWGAYGVSCFGIEGMMQTLADELVSNTSVRVNSIDPGAVRTRFRAQAYPGEDPNILPVPETILPLYLYLLGPDSRGITGRSWQAQESVS